MLDEEGGNTPTVSKGSIILHIDLDAFFASVEMISFDIPEDTPVIVGSDPEGGRGRGIVSTCNYPARRFGIHSAMAISESWRRCPEPPLGRGVYLRPRFTVYQSASRQAMAILNRECDSFEQASIDEAYLDITEVTKGDWDAAVALAKRRLSELVSELSLTASAGLGPTRVTAKMASEENKPAGIHRVMPTELYEFFSRKQLTAIPGIGPSSARLLSSAGIENLDDAMVAGEMGLINVLGESRGSWLNGVLEGQSSTLVSAARMRKSIGKETTFGRDVRDPAFIWGELQTLVEKSVARLDKYNLVSRTAEVKIRYRGFETTTHSRSLPVGMDDLALFNKVAHQLLSSCYDTSRAVRLIGFRLAGLEQMDTRQTMLSVLFEEE